MSVAVKPRTASFGSKARQAASVKGEHTIKIIASKIGYVSSEALYTFDVVLGREGVELTEEDVVIAALIIGVLLIIATLWKALI